MEKFPTFLITMEYLNFPLRADFAKHAELFSVLHDPHIVEGT